MNRCAVCSVGDIDEGGNRVLRHRLEGRELCPTCMFLYTKKLVSILCTMSDVLQRLVDVQNGPPLVKYTNDWNWAMDEAIRILRRYEQRGNP
jgi:hypothetical protein